MEQEEECHFQKKVQAPSNQRSQQDIPAPFPVNSNAFRLAWERFGKHIDLCGLRFQDLRHKAISRFFEMVLIVPLVAVILGHKDNRMHFWCTYQRPKDLVKKINQRSYFKIITQPPSQSHKFKKRGLMDRLLLFYVWFKKLRYPSSNGHRVNQ